MATTIEVTTVVTFLIDWIWEQLFQTWNISTQVCLLWIISAYAVESVGEELMHDAWSSCNEKDINFPKVKIRNFFIRKREESWPGTDSHFILYKIIIKGINSQCQWFSAISSWFWTVLGFLVVCSLRVYVF